MFHLWSKTISPVQSKEKIYNILCATDLMRFASKFNVRMTCLLEYMSDRKKGHVVISKKTPVNNLEFDHQTMPEFLYIKIRLKIWIIF